MLLLNSYPQADGTTLITRAVCCGRDVVVHTQCIFVGHKGPESTSSQSTVQDASIVEILDTDGNVSHREVVRLGRAAQLAASNPSKYRAVPEVGVES